MNRSQDSRINVRGITFWETICIFLVMMAFSGFHMWIYSAIQERWPDSAGDPTPYIVFMGGYVLLAGVAMTVMSGFLRYYSMGRPMRRIGEAARSIAQGDFTVRIAPLRSDGRKDYVEVMIDDFNKMAEELGSTESMKNDFIANVSHEIKTPLAIIQNYGDALLDDSLSPEKRREYSLTIVEASKRLSTLVTNILKLNKLENQEIVTNVKPYNLGEQLGQCILAFEDLWDQKELTLDVDLEDEVMVNCDESMLEIVWNNLFSNAIKFTEPGGEVRVAMWTKGDTVLVTVRDSGCGMNMETGKRIFDKFYQGDTSHSQEGNGLGLALVKRVIDLCGGEIAVDSKVGEGTIFTVQLKTV